MSHFYGVLNESRGEVTHCGMKQSGLTTTAASWQGAVRVTLYHRADGVDCACIRLTEWHGEGASPPKPIYDGPINGSPLRDEDYRHPGQRQDGTFGEAIQP